MQSETLWQLGFEALANGWVAFAQLHEYNLS
jgi:hypothetical protein